MFYFLIMCMGDEEKKRYISGRDICISQIVIFQY